MKGIIIGFVIFLAMSQLNGQEINIDCSWDTLYAKRIELIPLPLYFDCSGLKINKQIAFIPAPQELNEVLSTELIENIDLNQYNLFISSCSTSGCKTPSVRCRLFKDETKQETFLDVNILEFGLCKILRPIIIAFLVKKEDCPQLNNICFIKNNQEK
jgi:hypothetical protein